MSTAEQYRAKAAEYTELLKATSLPAEGPELRRLEQSYLVLAENEEWMADNREKMDIRGVDENCYGNAIPAQPDRYSMTSGLHFASRAMASTIARSRLAPR
jgi:hypothetical protein